jgi:uncharacterized protein with HEPN domain
MPATQGIERKHSKVTSGSLLPRYPAIEWKRVMGIRDILSHHYFDIDAEVVYSVCASRIHELTHVFRRMIDELPAQAPSES